MLWLTELTQALLAAARFADCEQYGDVVDDAGGALSMVFRRDMWQLVLSSCMSCVSSRLAGLVQEGVLGGSEVQVLLAEVASALQVQCLLAAAVEPLLGAAPREPWHTRYRACSISFT